MRPQAMDRRARLHGAYVAQRGAWRVRPTRLSLYWVQNLLVGYVAALCLLVALDGVFALLEELGRVGRGDYTTLAALSYVFWTLPGRVYEMTPMAALLGSLLWIGNLAARGELVAMAAAGVTRACMLVWTLAGGVLLVVAMGAVGELVAPRAELHAQSLRAFAISERVTFGRLGLWAREDERVVQVQAVMPGPVLLGVRVIEWDAAAARIRGVASIDRARWTGTAWRSEGVAVSRLPEDAMGLGDDASPPRIEHRRLAERDEAALLPVELLDVLTVDLRQMGFVDLLRYRAYLEANRLDANAVSIALWGRVFYPLSTLVLLALALAFVFGSQRDGGAGRRLFIGVIVGVVFAIAWRLSSHLGVVYGLPPVLAAAAPQVLALPLAAWLLLRSGRG